MLANYPFSSVSARFFPLLSLYLLSEGGRPRQNCFFRSLSLLSFPKISLLARSLARRFFPSSSLLVQYRPQSGQTRARTYSPFPFEFESSKKT